jgi:hypothetical protein
MTEEVYESISVFNCIETDTATYTAIIDYESEKDITFFDFSRNSDPEMSLVAILWKLYYDHMRFSVFVLTTLPSVRLPAPVTINKKSIKNIGTITHNVADVIKESSKIKKSRHL